MSTEHIDAAYVASLRRQLDEAQKEIERLKAWERASQEGHPTPCSLGPLCPYCEIARLQSALAVAQKDAEHWKTIVAKLPHTADGMAVLPGVTVMCPKGHARKILPSDNMGGGIYCCEGECWSDGCQGDSGSGTHYDSEQCTAARAAEGKQ